MSDCLIAVRSQQVWLEYSQLVASPGQRVIAKGMDWGESRWLAVRMPAMRQCSAISLGANLWDNSHHGRFVQVYSMSPFIYAGMYLAFIQECSSPNLVAPVYSYWQESSGWCKNVLTV